MRPHPSSLIARKRGKRRDFENQAIALINQLSAESDSGKPYSVSANSFAVDYHASRVWMINTYMNGRKHYTAAEHRP